MRTYIKWATLLLVLVVGCGKSKPTGPVLVAPAPGIQPTYPAPPPVPVGAGVYQGRTAPQWAEMLNDRDQKARETASHALRDLGKEGFPHLIKGMQSESWEVRLTCLRAAPKEQVVAHANETLPLLTTLAGDGNPQISQYAILRLGWFGTNARSALPLLKRKLEENGNNPEAREDILQAIIATHDTVPLLTGLLRESNPLLRKQAAIRLLGLGKNGTRIDAAGPALAERAENDEDPEIRAIASAGLKVIADTGNR